jgi:sphinganine-1-phosphate aldolase
MGLPAEGMTQDAVRDALEEMAVDDVRWRDGRVFTLAYSAGPEAHAVADAAARRFSSENALNTDAFPSLRRMQNDVVAIVLGWLHGGPGAAGFMTSGGTESILCAVKGARVRGRRLRGISSPNVVLPTTAHAAFEKACYDYDIESRRVPVRDDWRADVDAMAAAIDDNTVLVVASAPSYPQGVVDDVPAIAALASARGINCHVDACMGGVTLTYLARLGHRVTPFGFDVEGVTSISVDLHKYGYTAKGASVIAYRDKDLRSDQTFVTDNWLGGLYGSSGILGTKSGGPIAAAWAVMHHLGESGYLRLTRVARTATEQLVAGLHARDRVTVRAEPDSTLVAFGTTDDTLSVDAVAAALHRRGWYLDRQGPPPSLHCTVNAVHEGKIDEFLAALDEALDEAAGIDGGPVRAYGTID